MSKSKKSDQSHLIDVAKVFHEKGAGEHALGEGLNVDLGPLGHGQWFGFVTILGKKKRQSLGSTKYFNSDEAREELIKRRRMAIRGEDIEAHKIAQKIKAEGSTTFGMVAEPFMAAKVPQLKNEQHQKKYLSSVRTYGKPLWDMPVEQITPQDVHAALVKLWSRAPVMAAEVRGRFEAIFDHAVWLKKRPPGTNPAAWRGNLKHSGLKPPPKSGTTRGSHKSIAPADMPAFMVKLAAYDRQSARALELTILTALRTQEVIKMQRSWFDLDAALLTIPKEIMKMDHNLDHVVPLSPRAVELVREQIAAVEAERGECDYIWPGQHRQERDHMCEWSMLRFLQRDVGATATVHGFRASFETWALNATQDNGVSPLYGVQAVDFCLAHLSKGDEVRRAYMRDTMTAQRRIIMNDWANYVLTPPAAEGSNVTPLRRAS